MTAHQTDRRFIICPSVHLHSPAAAVQHRIGRWRELRCSSVSAQARCWSGRRSLHTLRWYCQRPVKQREPRPPARLVSLCCRQGVSLQPIQLQDVGLPVSPAPYRYNGILTLRHLASAGAVLPIQSRCIAAPHRCHRAWRFIPLSLQNVVPRRHVENMAHIKKQLFPAQPSRPLPVKGARKRVVHSRPPWYACRSSLSGNTEVRSSLEELKT